MEVDGEPIRDFRTYLREVDPDKEKRRNALLAWLWDNSYGTKHHLHPSVATKLLDLWTLVQRQRGCQHRDRYLSKEVLNRFRKSHFGRLVS
jgi:hypothetical protein